MITKVCGMRDADNIRGVDGLPVDWIGFIFWPRSSRYVSQKPAFLPTKAKRVGVFVDADIEDVHQHIEDYALDIVQLHGHETPAYVSQLQGVKVIKAISVGSRDDIAAYKPYEGLVDYFLFDTKCKTVGGSGEHFDWTVLTDYVGETPYLLSGGIGPDDAARVRQFLAVNGSPVGKCIGIDLNSRFEISPALKDVNQLKRFLYEQDQ